jgi:acetyltransferase-like isoleucine patch superfamily enzyme
MNFFSLKELKNIGFQKIGQNVKVSKNVNFYNFSGSIGSNCRIDDHTILIGNIDIGNYVHIAAFNLISASKYKRKIKISDYSGVGPRCYISCSTENYLVDDISNPTIGKKLRKNTIFADIHIGENVLIGAGSSIIPNSSKNIHIGNNVSIGTNSIIAKTVKKDCIIYNPNNFKNNVLKIKKNNNTLKMKKKLK